MSKFDSIISSDELWEYHTGVQNSFTTPADLESMIAGTYTPQTPFHKYDGDDLFYNLVNQLTDPESNLAKRMAESGVTGGSGNGSGGGTGDGGDGDDDGGGNQGGGNGSEGTENPWKDKDSITSQDIDSIVSKGNLNDYSWEAISKLGELILSTNTIDHTDYNKLIGLTKKIKTNSYDTQDVRIVGVKADSGNGTKNPFTFESVNAWYTVVFGIGEFQGTRDFKTNPFKTKIDKVEEELPESLKAVIKSTVRRDNYTSTSAPYEQYATFEAKVFIESAKDLGWQSPNVGMAVDGVGCQSGTYSYYSSNSNALRIKNNANGDAVSNYVIQNGHYYGAFYVGGATSTSGAYFYYVDASGNFVSAKDQSSPTDYNGTNYTTLVKRFPIAPCFCV